MSSRQCVLVVIPTYNEADNIHAVIERVLVTSPDVHILVVDDNSPDGTAAVVERHPVYLRNVFLLKRRHKEGLGAAYRAGFSWAIGLEYDVVVQMDADLSHPPERIPALVAGLETADVTVGSRYVADGACRSWSWPRRLVSWAGNTYVRLVLRLPVRDATAGFKAFRRPALEAIGATGSASNGYCFQIENTWRAVRMGLVVTEVPITFCDRAAGTSKMSGGIVCEALGRVLVWRWEELRDGRHLVRSSNRPGSRTGRSRAAA